MKQRPKVFCETGTSKHSLIFHPSISFIDNSHKGFSTENNCKVANAQLVGFFYLKLFMFGLAYN